MITTRLRMCALVAAALTGPTSLAHAAASGAGTPVPQTTTLQGVDVSAVRADGFAPTRTEIGPYQGMDALDVPATVNVVTHDVIEAQGDQGLFDALRNVAGVSRKQLNGLAYDNLSVRGIALDNRTSYYFNGVLPFDDNIFIPLQDKQRVEVLKGASALYYGFTVPAGIVNLVTKRAGATPVARLDLSTDSNGSAGASIDLGRRFGADQQFGVRVNALSKHVRTRIDGVQGMRRMGSVGSVALDWQLSPGVTLQYDYEHIEQKLPEQAGITPLSAVDGHIAKPPLPDDTRLLAPPGYPSKARADTHLLRADVALGENWSGMLALGRSVTRRDRWLWIFRNYDIGSGEGQLRGSKQNGQRYENIDGRAEISGQFDTGPISHELRLGVSRNRLHQPDFTTYYFVAAQNLYGPVSVRRLSPSGTPKLFHAETVWDTGSYAIDRMRLSSDWHLTLGLRHAVYHSTQAGSPNDDVEKNAPSASLVYSVDAQTRIYASYIEGLESSGTAPDTAANAGQTLPAAVSRQHEVGVRRRFGAHTLVSLAYFDIRQPAASLDAQNVYRLDGRARYRGVEFSAQGRLMPRLSLTATALWLHARRTRSTDPALLGKTPEDTPRSSASVFAQYTLASLPRLSLNAGAYYTARRAVNDEDQAWIGGYTLFTLGAGYRLQLHSHTASVRLNIDNLANKHYWSAVGSSQMAVGLGRTAMLDVGMDL